jgi:hypothetical protein
MCFFLTIMFLLGHSQLKDVSGQQWFDAGCTSGCVSLTPTRCCSAAASCWCPAGWNAVQGVARGALSGVCCCCVCLSPQHTVVVDPQWQCRTATCVTCCLQDFLPSGACVGCAFMSGSVYICLVLAPAGVCSWPPPPNLLQGC